MNSERHSSVTVSKRRNRRRSSKTINSNRLVGLKKLIGFPFRLFAAILKSSWFPSFILATFFFVYSSNFIILLDPFNATQHLLFNKVGGGFVPLSELMEATEAIKSSIGLVFYFFAAVLMLVHFHDAYRFIWKNTHLIIMLTLPIVGTYISVIPEKVLFSVIQLLAGFCIALTYSITRKNKSHTFLNFCLLLLWPIGFVHIFSYVLLLLNNIDIAPFLEGTARYGGLSGNPNWFGSSATIGSWLALYVLLHNKPGSFTKVIVGVLLALFFISIFMSGSGTSKAIVVVVFLGMLVLRVYSQGRKLSTKLTYIFSIFFLLLMGFGVYFVNNSFSDLSNTITESLGKESDLTGRTDIWEFGLDAIAERPILGWGLDNHETVFGYKKYEIPLKGITHYHNGYIDSIVSSGFLAFLFVIYNASKYFRMYLSNLSVNSLSFGMLGPAIILFMHNFSEYSLMRPLSTVFQLYLCAYCLLAAAVYHQKENANGISANTRLSRKGRSRRRRIRLE